MTGSQIVEMPLDGRSVTDLAVLVPGVVPNADGAQGGPFSVNGARADNTNFTIDGMNAQNSHNASYITPSLESVESFVCRPAAIPPNMAGSPEAS